METKLSKSAAKKLAQERELMELKKSLLSREQALDDVTSQKIKDKWFNTLLNIRVPEMQDNLKHILHYMEKLIESQNFRKTIFEEERQTLDEMNKLQSQSHGSAIEVLYGIYEKRVDDLLAEFRKRAAMKKKESEEEFREIENREMKTRENMQSMLFKIENNRNKKEDTMNCDMFLKLDDERSKNTEKLENLRSSLEKKMEMRWSEIGATLMEYDENTSQRRNHYLQLKIKDDADSKTIYLQMKKTQKLFEHVEYLKNCLENSYAPLETLSLIKDLREERSKFFDSFKYLKKILSEEILVDTSHLKCLTRITNSITKELRKIKKQGERVLTLLKICKKFETEAEKVIPVGRALYNSKTNQATDPFDKKRHSVARDEKEDKLLYDLKAADIGRLAKSFSIMNNFWMKAAHARMTACALNNCIHELEKENIQLKSYLVTYFQEAKDEKKGKLL